MQVADTMTNGTMPEVKRLLAKQLKLDEAAIGDDARLIEDLGADSIDLVEMLMIIEEHLSISISDEDALTLKTVRDVAEFVDNHSSKR